MRLSCFVGVSEVLNIVFEGTVGAKTRVEKLRESDLPSSTCLTNRDPE